MKRDKRNGKADAVFHAVDVFLRFFIFEKKGTHIRGNMGIFPKSQGASHKVKPESREKDQFL